MSTQNDFSIKNLARNPEERPKSNWIILVFGLLIIMGLLIFAPITHKRSYTDTTQVRLMDAVLIEFEWSAEYTTPLFILPKDRNSYEKQIRGIMLVKTNESVKEFFTSEELYNTPIDSIQIAIYRTSELKELTPPLDTVILTKMQFDERFLQIVEAMYEAKIRRIEDSLEFEIYQQHVLQKLETIKLNIE